MKRIFLLLSLIFSSLQILAADEERTGWSDETKSYVLFAFIALNIWLVVRTFRNKPSA